MGFIVPLLYLLPVGWITGLMVNYLSDVLPIYRRPAQPVCMACKSPMSWKNYILFPRPCSVCGARRKTRVWIVQLAFLLAATWLWYRMPDGWNLAAALVLLAYLGLVAVIDIEHRVILHSVSLAGLVLSLVMGIWQHGLWRTVGGGAVGFIVMLALYWLGFLFIRYQKRRQGLEQPEDALGFGDVNLSGVVGLLLGWPGVTLGLILTVLLAGGFSLAYLLVKLVRKEYQANLAIPYGPFLVASAAWLLLI